MFTFRLPKRTQRLLGSPLTTTPLRSTIIPRLEALEDRTMPSASTLPVVSVASPAAVPSVAAVTSYVSLMMDQWSQTVAVIQQELSLALNAVGQQIAQEASAVQQQWDNLLGINPSPPNPSPSAAVTQPSSDRGTGRGNSSGSGTGTGAMTSGHNTANQALSNTKQQSGSGSGSGVSAKSTHENVVAHGSMKAQPMDGGSGLGSSGSGTGSEGNGAGSEGTAIVTGKVWLDNNGNGDWDPKEMGYQGATVQLFDASSPQPTLADSTTTGGDGSYDLTASTSPGAKPYFIHVVFPFMCEQTIFGYSQINGDGDSAQFELRNNGFREVNAGLRSMNVTIPDDDPGGPTQQDQITLRDAIQTGNNGPPFHQVTFYTAPGTSLSGTITLQATLDAIKKSYDVAGPGASTLMVSGDNAFRVFQVQATSAISGLTIELGNDTTGQGGGGILNEGKLTLEDDIVTANQTTSNGGGIYDTSAATLILSSVFVTENNAQQNGGGLYNVGDVSICCNSWIQYNEAGQSGGGIFNLHGPLSASDDTQINDNTAGTDGGGVYNFEVFKMQGGSISNNTAMGNGGGIFNLGGPMTLSGSGIAVQENTAKSSGGGLYVAGGGLTLKGVMIGTGGAPNEPSNRANAGGGIFILRGGVKMTGCGISNNAASSAAGGGAFNGRGGGIYTTGGSLTLTGVRIYHNVASINGGGLFLGTGATVKMSGGTFYSNSALNGSGGGIYNSQGTLTLTNNVGFIYNNALAQGGGLYLRWASTTTFNVVVVTGNQAAGPLNGKGVYLQNAGGGLVAVVNFQNGPPPNNALALTDNDDPGNFPVIGP